MALLTQTDVEETMKPISKQEFKKLYSKQSVPVKQQITEAFILQAQPKLNHRLLDARNRQEILTAVSTYVINKQPLGYHQVYKIYLLSDFTIELVNSYVMQGTQCYYKKMLRARHRKPTQRVIAKRRASIKSWSGETIPRRVLDKLSVPIANQRDYDRYQQQITGMSREKYRQQVLGIW